MSASCWFFVLHIRQAAASFKRRIASNSFGAVLILAVTAFVWLSRQSNSESGAYEYQNTPAVNTHTSWCSWLRVSKKHSHPLQPAESGYKTRRKVWVVPQRCCDGKFRGDFEWPEKENPQTCVPCDS
jgi:hypothetical protein